MNQFTGNESSQPGNYAHSLAAVGTGERIRVVFLIRALTVGGAQRQLVALAGGLDQTVFDVVIMTLYEGGAFVGDLRATGVRVISLAKRSRWDLIGFFLRLIKISRGLRPHILHAYMPGQNCIAVLLKLILPGTRIVWGIRASAFDPLTQDWLSRASFRIQTLLSGFADLIIFNSNAGKKFHLAQGVAPDRAIVIYNGIDTVRFRPDKRSGLRLRSSWQVPEGSVLIGLTGRIVAVKDHPTFLRAAAILSRVRPEAWFVCIGYGLPEYVGYLRDLAAELGVDKKVIWSGELIEDLPDAYNAMNIYCSSSCAEGTSNVIAEAMACGVPCVVTDVGDSRRIVGETGVVVPPRDPQALAEGLDEMVERLRHQPHLCMAARQRIESSFSIDSLTHNTSKELIDLR